MLKPLTMDGLAAELKSIHERIDHQYASLRRSGIVQEDRASFLIPLVLEHCDNTLRRRRSRPAHLGYRLRPAARHR